MNPLDNNINSSQDSISDYDGSEDSHTDDEDVSLSSNSSSSNLDDFNYNALIEKAQHKTADKITNIATRAIELVDQYTLQKKEEFLTDPIKVYDEVDVVCDEMKGAWEEYRSDLANIQIEKEAHEQKIDSHFRKVFLNLATETFADELDDLRHGRVSVNTATKTGKHDKKTLGEQMPDISMQENIVMPKPSTRHENDDEDVNVDMKILVDMLESGMDRWDIKEKELLIQDWNNRCHGHDKDKDQSVMTPHERRRRVVFGENVK